MSFLGVQRACCDAYGIMISVVTSDEAHWYAFGAERMAANVAPSRVPNSSQFHKWTGALTLLIHLVHALPGM